MVIVDTIEIKMKDSEAREAALSDQLSDLQTVCYELRQSAKQLETAHSDDLVKRGEFYLKWLVINASFSMTRQAESTNDQS